MKALIYLTKRSFINNMKKAVHKPSTLIALIFGIAYGIFIIVGIEQDIPPHKACT